MRFPKFGGPFLWIPRGMAMQPKGFINGTILGLAGHLFHVFLQTIIWG